MIRRNLEIKSTFDLIGKAIKMVESPGKDGGEKTSAKNLGSQNSEIQEKRSTKTNLG